VYDNGGNNNGRIDPGETVDLTATFWNIGGADLADMSTTLNCNNPYISITDNSGYFGTLQMDSTKENTADPYVLTADPSTPHGTLVDFSLEVTGSGYSETFDFSLLVGQPVPTDSGYYYVYYSGGPHPQSPVFEWIAIDSTQTTYSGTSLDLDDNQSVTVSLPFTFKYYSVDYDQITICSNGWIAMGDQTEVDWTNSAIPNSDGPQAMVAGIWDDLDPGNEGAPSDIYYYYDETTHRFIIEYFQVEHFPSGSPETFEIILCDEDYYPTPTNDGEIYVQYLVEQQQLDNTVGIENVTEDLGIQYFYNNTYHVYAEPITDQFALRYTTIPPGQTGVREYSSRVNRIIMDVFPSITKERVTIDYSIPFSTNRIQIKIYDISGRLIKRFDNLTRDARVIWDISDDSGRSAAKGVYFVILETDDYQMSQKIVVVE